MAHLHLRKSTRRINSLTHEAKSIKGVLLLQRLVPHPSLGDPARTLFVLRKFIKSITLRLVCEFLQFSLLSAFLKQASVSLCCRRKATLLKKV